MQRLVEHYGAPVHMFLLAAPTTEDGKTLRAKEELIPVLGKFCHALIRSNVGVDAAAYANNNFGLLTSETEDGELRMLGSMGFMQGEFDGEEVAQQHAAARLSSVLLPAWIAANDSEGAVQRESEAASVTHMDDETILLTHAQSDDSGAAHLDPFDKELANIWKKKRPKVRALPAELVQIDEAYRLRVLDAIAGAAERLGATTAAYANAASGHTSSLLNSIGPSAARSVISHGMLRVDRMLATLGDQRAALAEDVANVGALAADAVSDLEAQLSQGGAYWRHRKQIQSTIELLTEIHALSYAFALTEETIAALGAARERLLHWQSTLVALSDHMTLAAAALHKAWAAYEGSVRTPVDELINRPLADPRDLRALYEEAVGPWDGPSDLASLAFRDAAGKLESWLRNSQEEIQRRALSAALPVFRKIALMSADDFMRWKCVRTGVSSDVALRNLLDLAPILYRYNRTRLPEGDTMYDGSYVLVGVPDRDTSVFMGNGLGGLVSTDDHRHISVLRLKLGLPASALFDYDRMQVAYNKVKDRGDVVVDIYPELYDDEPASTAPKKPASKAGRRKGGRGTK